VRSVRYSVASSLDGFIAGPGGEYDWIPGDPDADFGAMLSRYETMLVGRRSFEALQAAGGAGSFDMEMFVFSRTLDPDDRPAGVTIVADRAGDFVRDLKSRDGGDIWLFGGGDLFRSLLAEGVVDGVDVAVVPVLLGEGIPFLPAPGPRASLVLETHRIYERTGTVRLEYTVV